MANHKTRTFVQSCLRNRFISPGPSSLGKKPPLSVLRFYRLSCRAESADFRSDFEASANKGNMRHGISRGETKTRRRRLCNATSKMPRSDDPRGLAHGISPLTGVISREIFSFRSKPFYEFSWVCGTASRERCWEVCAAMFSILSSWVMGVELKEGGECP